LHKNGASYCQRGDPPGADHRRNVLRGSQLDVAGGVGLVVSQWDTATGWPYRAMQFKATVNDTTTTGLSSRDASNL